MMNGQQQQVTAEQLEQAIQQVAQAVDWSEPPRSDTVSGGARRRSNDQALMIVVSCAREAMKSSAAPAVPPSAEVTATEAERDAEPKLTTVEEPDV